MGIKIEGLNINHIKLGKSKQYFMIHPLQNGYWGNQNWGLNKHNKLRKINIVFNPLTTTTSIKIGEGIKWLT